jgi:competence ComEA-like helix-hairpin-helix protein
VSVLVDDVHLKAKQCDSLYVSVALCWILVGVFVADYVTGQLSRKDISVYNTVNPNSAPLESLVRLPGVGPATATSIIEYRKDTPVDKEAFTQPADLQSIKGIGPKTVEKIEPWLSF